MSPFWKDQSVVVTGGGGFLGSHVVEKLRAASCERVVVVRSREFDLTKETQVRQLFEEHPADIVIHLAGLVGGIGANKARPAEFFYQNLIMGVLVMHFAWKTGTRKFVAAAAGCGYPEHAQLPLRENSFWNGLPQQESAPYSLAKRMLHVQSLAYWRQYRFPAVVVVPGNIYGPFDNFDLEDAHVIPALVRKFVEATAETEEGGRDGRAVTVWGTGRPTRDFVYAGDVAEGILRAAEVYDHPELVNLSSGEENSIRDVVEMIVQITGYTGKILWDDSRPDGQARRLMDMTKAKRDLGFEPRISLREGLRLTIDWFWEHQIDGRKATLRLGASRGAGAQ
jgi:GDP-L-fucose synthase